MAQSQHLHFDMAMDDARKPVGSTVPSRLLPSPDNDLSVTLHTQIDDVRDAWITLERDHYGSLHQSLDWCSAWAQTHDRPLALILGSRNGQPMFLLPLEIVPENGIRIARFVAGPFANINTGLFTPSLFEEDSTRLGDVIVREARRLLSGRADLIRLANMPLLWRDVRHPFAHLPSVENQNRAFQLPILETIETTIGQLNGKRRRKKYRNQVRRLEELGGFEHYRPTTRQEREALLETFFAQKGARFQSLGLPNVFKPRETQAFFHALLQLECRGKDYSLDLHAIRMTAPGMDEIAAIAGLSRKGDHVICQFGSITEGPAMSASPGELLFWLMIEQCVADGVSIFDFGVGDQGYKRSWCTVETVQHDILLPITLKGRLAASFYNVLTRAKSAVKSNRALYAALQKLRAKRMDTGEEAAE